MTRNFGLTRRDLPRARMISDEGRAWLKDIIAGFGLIAIFGLIIWLEVHFPNGLVGTWAYLRDLHVEIVASGGAR